MSSQIILDDHLVQFLESGIPIQLGTRDAFNKTAYTRSWGCKVNDDHQSVMLFLYRSYMPQALQNIRDNGAYAAFFVNVFTYETYQLKGTHARVLDDLAPYVSVLESFNEAQYKMVEKLGLPRITADSMAGKSIEDYVPVYCPVKECFKQTPGPGAGDRV